MSSTSEPRQRPPDPILARDVKIKTRRDRVELRSNKHLRFGILLFGLSIGLLALLWWLQEERFIGQGTTLILVVLPAASLWLAMQWVLNRNSISWRSGHPTLRIIQHGFFQRERLLLPRARLGAVLDLEALSEQQRGDTVIKLRDLNTGVELLLARSDDHAALHGIFLRLAEATAQAEDRTMDSIALPGGEILPCSRVPLGKGSLSFKARRLEFPSPETARFGPTRVMRMTFVALLLAPVVIVALIIQFADWDLAGKFFGEIFSALAALVGFWGTFTRLETHVLTADHARGTFTARPWVPWPWSQTRRWLLIDIGALQLASRWIANPHDEAKGYVNYEINLVLKTPGGERVHLVTDRHEKRLLWEATQLAAFLKVPLLDHRTLEEPPASATEQSADGTGNPPLLPASRPDTRELPATEL